MTEMRYYNGITEAEMADGYGFKKLGIENCKPFFTRGVAVDVAGLKGRMLNVGEEITVADVQAALKRQNIAETSFTPGDAIFPNPNKDVAFVVHNELITKHGIYLHENMDFTEVLRDKLYEFVYVFSPLRIKGGTGSPGHPIAIG
jgi:hypothetical protein